MKKIFFIAAMMFTSGSAFSATQPAAPTPAPPVSSSAQPVTISAVKSLEWNRKAQTYTARQDVIASQGAVNIHSDTLVAHYNDNNGGTDIKTLEAEGHVAIHAAPYVATGDHAVYNVKTGNATLTGKDLKITSDDSILTAQDRIEFTGSENKMTAIGQPVATKGDDTLTADSMSAFFTKDAAGKLTANKITSHGHVTIKTPTETATGDEAVYDIPSQKAVLSGKVRILQDKNWLEGTRADVDMVTGISRLSGAGNTATEGRVTGTFYPQTKEDSKPADTKPPGQKT